MAWPGQAKILLYYYCLALGQNLGPFQNVIRNVMIQLSPTLKILLCLLLIFLLWNIYSYKSKVACICNAWDIICCNHWLWCECKGQPILIPIDWPSILERALNVEARTYYCSIHDKTVLNTMLVLKLLQRNEFYQVPLHKLTTNSCCFAIDSNYHGNIAL